MKGIGKLKGQYQMDNSVKHHNFVAQHSTVKSKRKYRKSSDVNSLSVPIPKPLSEFLSSVSFKMSIPNSSLQTSERPTKGLFTIHHTIKSIRLKCFLQKSDNSIKNTTQQTCMRSKLKLQ